jgi:colicin import membrane protein
MKDLTLVVTSSKAIEVFQGGNPESLIANIEKEVRSVVPDLSTDQGRKAIASLSAKVSKSKVALDNLGKESMSKHTEIINSVNASRKLIRDRLDALRDEARKPLTEWEVADQAAKAAEVARLLLLELQKQVENDHEMGLLLNDKFDRDLAEVTAKAEQERIKAVEIELKEQAALDKRIAAEAAEAERLRQEEAVRAAERETQETEARLKRQTEEAEKQRLEAIEVAKAQAIATEQRRLDDIKQVEIDRLAAISKAEQDKQLAVKAEQDRVHAEKERDRIETERREADKNHKKKINNEALAGLKKGGLSAADARLVVELIAKKMIANVVINY